uniref:Uncharacterized protein n=1 Tax=Oryza meridionalis TaxID=40149 RepID=A0A0E0C3L0_9ORYZ
MPSPCQQRRLATSSVGSGAGVRHAESSLRQRRGTGRRGGMGQGAAETSGVNICGAGGAAETSASVVGDGGEVGGAME